MTAKPPSPSHSALPWSIPGAALLSVPFGVWLSDTASPFLPFSIASWRDSRLEAMGCGLLGLVALVSGSYAIVLCCQIRHRAFGSFLLLIFNLVATVAAAFVVRAAAAFFSEPNASLMRL